MNTAHCTHTHTPCSSLWLRRAERAVRDGGERAGGVLFGQGGLYCPPSAAGESLAQLRQRLPLEDEDEEQVDAVQGVQHAGQAVEPVVACDPGDELKHPDDAHHHRQLHVQVEPVGDISERRSNASAKVRSHHSRYTQSFLMKK